MKKIVVLLLALVMVFGLVACSRDYLNHQEYLDAEMDSEVTIEAYVQGKQSWYQDKCIVYLQDKDGGYIAYDMACSEADYAKLTEGTKIRVTGTKSEWSGLVEIMNATFTFVDGAKPFVATPADVTSIFGDEAAIIAHQGEVITLKGMTIKAIDYKNGEPGDDIYVTVQKGDVEKSITVERYLTAPGTETYEAFATLQEGDVVDIVGFLYWYNGVDVHITSVAKSAN